MTTEYHDATRNVKCVTTTYHEGMNTLGDYVRERRSILGWSLIDTAAAAELSKSELSALENNKIKLPGADKRRRLAAVLGVRHIDLLVAAGELSEDEAPGLTPNTPSLDPGLDRRVQLLRALDLSRDNRGITLDAVLLQWAAQDRLAIRQTPRQQGTQQ
jgi:transcriptional regulator with XRE-family HTH domain